MIESVVMETDRENMLAVLEAQDFWKTEFLESMCDEDLIEFGIEQGVWKLPDDTSQAGDEPNHSQELNDRQGTETSIKSLCVSEVQDSPEGVPDTFSTREQIKEELDKDYPSA